MCIALTIGGIIFLLVGLINIFIVKQFESGLGFSILGGLMLLTGVYYDFKVYAFRCAETED